MPTRAGTVAHSIRLLVVDDDRELASSISRALPLPGTEVLCLSDADSALAATGDARPDVFLIALNAEGIQLCSHLRANPAHSRAVIVLTSATADPSARGREIALALDSGADDYLVKPFGMEELAGRIRGWMRMRSAHGATAAAARQAEERLAHEQAYSQAILSSMNDAVLVVSSGGEIRSCNRHLLRMLGLEESEVIGRHFDTLLAGPGLPRTGTFARLRQATAHSEVRDYDCALARGAGSVPVSLSCARLGPDSPEHQEFIVVARDISVRKRLQAEQQDYAQRLEAEVAGRTAEIRRSEEKYRALFENVSHAVVLTDLDSRLESWNKAAEKLFGLADSARGQPVSLALCHNPTCPGHAALLERVRETGSWGHECTVNLPGDTELALGMSVATIHDESGRAQGIIWVIADLSERERLAENARRARGYAESLLAMAGVRGKLIGQGPAHQDIVRFVRSAADAPSPVIILGESGTGKEVVARAIHQSGPLAERPFVIVDCSSVRSSLLESELFGHEKGAFTGAVEAKPGLVEVAEGGTLFVDEIGEMPLELQPKLLRVLERGEFRRLGSVKDRRANIRVIAATNRHLEHEVRKGAFRADLFFRLNVLGYIVPPLRERREDIPLLARHFLENSRVTVAAGKSFRDDTMERLSAYSWPGNVRELANLVERAVILSGDSATIRPEHLPAEVRAARLPGATGSSGALRLEAAERSAIEAALVATGGNKTRAAEMLGISRLTLRRKIVRFNIGPLEGKPPA